MNSNQARYLLNTVPTTEKRAAMDKSAVVVSGGIGAGIGALVNLLRGRSAWRGAGVGAMTGAGGELGTGLIPVPFLGTALGAGGGYTLAQALAGGDPDDAQAAAGDNIDEVEQARTALTKERDELQAMARSGRGIRSRNDRRKQVARLNQAIDGYSKHIDRLRYPHAY